MNFEIANRMSTIKGSAIREIFKYAANPEVISLAGGNPAPELFPAGDLAKIAGEYLTQEPVLSLQYGITEGYMPLRDALKARLKSHENIDFPDDELIIMSGAQQGLELTTKVLVNEGDTVIVEEPSFIGATNAFRSYGANLAGIPMDGDGIDLEKLENYVKSDKKVKFLYTIPSFQNPTGITMSLEKRKKLYELACKYDFIILEDNPYGDLTFDGTKIPTIKSMDTEGRVIYNGSFSKILAPGLRVGFLCANKDIIAKIVVGKQVSDVHTSMLPQLLAYKFMTEYDLDALIEKMRANYAHKCQTMLDAMDKYFGENVTYTRPGGGLFIWCTLPEGTDTLALSKKAIEKKVVYVPGNTFMTDIDTPVNTLRLNYSTMSDERIVEGIKRLAEVFTF